MLTHDILQKYKTIIIERAQLFELEDIKIIIPEGGALPSMLLVDAKEDNTEMIKACNRLQEYMKELGFVNTKIILKSRFEKLIAIAQDEAKHQYTNYLKNAVPLDSLDPNKHDFEEYLPLGSSDDNNA